MPSSSALAEAFWTAKLLPATEHAQELSPLLQLLSSDIKAFENSLYHPVLEGPAFLFTKGKGKVLSTERNRVIIQIEGLKIALRTGPVFGNAVRDGCGLLSLNEAAGLTEFNTLSAELNRLVEERVLPHLRAVPAGSTVAFSACAEVRMPLPESGPILSFIPLKIEVEQDPQ